MPKTRSARSFLTAICYADIFDYPLDERELVYWSVGPVLEKRAVKPFPEGLYFLRGRKNIIPIRQKRQQWARDKWAIAERVGRWLRFVPSLYLVGVTGGLAMDNAHLNDDIDLFFIVSPGTLWTSRLVITLLVELLGLRRHPEDTQVENKVCLNMFMAADTLGLSAAERDLFAAHEVLQMEPLWDKQGMYKKFLKANSWVRNFLPNAWRQKTAALPVMRYTSGVLHGVCVFAFRLCERPVRYLQLRYMELRRTNEVITDTVLRFHPRDVRVRVKKELGRRLARYNIPLDNVFYGR